MLSDNVVLLHVDRQCAVSTVHESVCLVVEERRDTTQLKERTALIHGVALDVVCLLGLFLIGKSVGRTSNLRLHKVHQTVLAGVMRFGASNHRPHLSLGLVRRAVIGAQDLIELTPRGVVAATSI